MSEINSRSDLKGSSGLSRDEEVEVLYQALKQDTQSESDISFHEFVKGVMDFPFLLEQFQQELEGLDPSLRSGGKRSDLFLNIDCIEEEPVEDSQSSLPKSLSKDSKKFIFSHPTFEFPSANRGVDCSFLIQAYDKFAYLSKQSMDSQPAPTPNFSQSDLQSPDFDELILKTSHLIQKLQNRFQLSDQFNLMSVLIEGVSLVVQQLNESVGSYGKILEDLEGKMQLEREKNREMERRCEMAETSYGLIFEKLRNLEEEMKIEHSQAEQIQQETFILRDLLRSEKAQGALVSTELQEIQADISQKEDQILRLQREIRRLNSRKVLNEMSSGNEGALEVRNVRKERMSSGNFTYFPSKTPVLPSPSSSLTRISENRQINILNSLISDKQRQLKDTGNSLKDKQRQLEKWEYQLKCKETDLEVSTSTQIEELKAELEVLRKKLFSEQNKNKQLELLGSEGMRPSTRMETTEALGEISLFSGGIESDEIGYLTIELVGNTRVVPKRKEEEREIRRLEKENCCSFF